jgi:hypothetical protein
MSTWHIPDDQIDTYQQGTSTPVLRWSAEAHLLRCAACRDRLTVLAGPGVVAPGWERLDERLDEIARGPLERLLIFAGVPDHTARLLCCTPLLGRAWLLAVAVSLVVAVLGAQLAGSLAGPLPLLAVAPLLPVAGVAVAFSRTGGPGDEVALVAPMPMFRLVLLRAVAVLATTSVLSLAASAVVPRFGAAAFGWLLPALALTLLSLAALPWLGPARSPALAGIAWLAALAVTVRHTGASSLFTGAGQGAVTAAALLAAAVLIRSRARFNERSLPR